MGFPCDIFVNKLSAQYVVVLYRYYFLVLLYCSVIPLHISGGIRVRTSQELNVVAFWSWNLDVVVFWSWDLDVVVYSLHGLVFVIIVKTKKTRIIMSIMLLKNISVVQIYATSICIIYA